MSDEKFVRLMRNEVVPALQRRADELEEMAVRLHEIRRHRPSPWGRRPR